MRTTRTLRTDLPVDVWERFNAEAAARGVPVGRHLRNLMVARDARKYPAVEPVLDVAPEQENPS